MAVTGAVAAAAIGAGGSYLSANAQAGAAKHAADVPLQMYNQTRSDLLPFMQGGAGAFSNLSALLGPGMTGGGATGSPTSANPGASQLSQFGVPNTNGMMSALQNYPGYQFALQQGQQGLDRTAASRGLLLSGGQLKDTIGYNQGMASQLFGQYFNQNLGLAQLGENAAAQSGNTGQNAASTASSAFQNAGTASASGIAGVTNQLGGLLQNQSLLTSLSSPSSSPTNWAGYGGDFSEFDMSDRRLKTDIKKVGKAESGLTIYSYRFKGSSKTQLGVMADEVRVIAPDAVKRLPSGYDAVNYRKVSQLPTINRRAA